MGGKADQSRNGVSRRSAIKSAGVVGALVVGTPVLAKSQEGQDDEILGVFTEYEVEFIGSQPDTATTTPVDETTPAEETTVESATQSFFYDGGIDLNLFQGFPLPVASVERLEECDWMAVELSTLSDADDFLRLIGLIEPTELEIEGIRIISKGEERVLRCRREANSS